MTSGWWTWASGSKSPNQNGRYGSRGILSSVNMPGARRSHSMIIDQTERAIYVYGGFGYDGLSSTGRIFAIFGAIAHDVQMRNFKARSTISGCTILREDGGCGFGATNARIRPAVTGR